MIQEGEPGRGTRRRRRETENKRKELGMAEPARRSLLFSTCSLLMSALFAYSASVQRDDPDWYLWLPLYAAASAVNLLQVGTSARPFRTAARAALLVGAALFLKVIVEGYVGGAAGFFSLDMRERVVREKLGSGLVAISMFLHLEAPPSISNKKPKLRSYIDYGGFSDLHRDLDHDHLHHHHHHHHHHLLLPDHHVYFGMIGMATTVAISVGLCIRFFVFHKPEMRK